MYQNEGLKYLTKKDIFRSCQKVNIIILKDNFKLIILFQNKKSERKICESKIRKNVMFQNVRKVFEYTK